MLRKVRGHSKSCHGVCLRVVKIFTISDHSASLLWLKFVRDLVCSHLVLLLRILRDYDFSWSELFVGLRSLALHFSPGRNPNGKKRRIPISLSCSPCEGNLDLHENLDTEQASFRLTLGIFLVCGGLLVLLLVSALGVASPPSSVGGRIL